MIPLGDNLEQEDTFALTLSRDEQLVLCEFLWRWEDSGKLEIVDMAEWRVLNTIHGQLEKRLSEPFRSDYLELLEKSRAALRPEGLTLEDIQR